MTEPLTMHRPMEQPRLPKMIYQRDSTDCGTTCLAMILTGLGLPSYQAVLRDHADVSGRGIGLARLSEVAAGFGFRVLGLRVPVARLGELTLPVIAHVRGNHYVVLVAWEAERVRLLDPAQGEVVLPLDTFAAMATGAYLRIEGHDLPQARNALEILERRRAEERWQLWKRFYRPAVRATQGLVGAAVLATVGLQVLGLVFPLVTQRFVDRLRDSQAGPILAMYVLGLAGAGSMQLVLGALRGRWLARVQSGWERHFFHRVMHHYLALAPRTFERYTVEDFVSRLHANRVVQQLFSGGVLQSALDAVFAVVYVAALAMYSPWLAVLATLILGLAVLAVARFMEPVRRARRMAVHGVMASMASGTDTLSGFHTIKAHAAEQPRFLHWLQRAETATQGAEEVVRQEATARWILGGLALGGQLGLAIGAAAIVSRGGMSAGEFVAVSAIGTILMIRLQSIGGVWLSIADVEVAFERLNDLLLRRPEICELAEAGADQGLRGTDVSLAVEALSFSYDETGPRALDSVDFRVEGPGYYAIVGRNGSGKSTLLKVLAGLYLDYQGRVLLHGEDQQGLGPQRARVSVSTVLQEVHLVEGSLRENLLMAAPHASDADMLAAVHTADLDGLIRQGGLGLRFPVMRGGHNLSVGQRARIALARVFLSKAEIVLLDEAAAALDPDAERRVLGDLWQHCQGKVVFYVTHRLNSVVKADRVFLMDGGRLVDHAPHEALLERSPLYRSLASAGLGPLEPAIRSDTPAFASRLT